MRYLSLRCSTSVVMSTRLTVISMPEVTDSVSAGVTMSSASTLTPARYSALPTVPLSSETRWVCPSALTLTDTARRTSTSPPPLTGSASSG